MQLVKDNQIIQDDWQFIDDATDLAEGNVIISVSRLQQDGGELLKHQGRLAVRLVPSSMLPVIENQLDKLAMIELYFPDLADGRLFSLAWLLRNRYGFQGEIRAGGHYIPEQVFYLSRVGVNAFAPIKPEDLEVTLTNLNDFSVKYQPSVN